MLVLDCRTAEAFEDSHISLSPNIINISKSYMGMTSFQIPNQLSNEQRLLFEKRKSFEKVRAVIDGDLLEISRSTHHFGQSWNCVVVMSKRL